MKVNIVEEDGKIFLLREDDDDFLPENALDMSEELIERYRLAEKEYDAVTMILRRMQTEFMRPYWDARQKEREILEAKVDDLLVKTFNGLTSTYWNSPNFGEIRLAKDAFASDAKTSTYQMYNRGHMAGDVWAFVYNGTYAQMKLHLTALAPRYGIDKW